MSNAVNSSASVLDSVEWEDDFPEFEDDSSDTEFSVPEEEMILCSTFPGTLGEKLTGQVVKRWLPPVDYDRYDRDTDDSNNWDFDDEAYEDMYYMLECGEGHPIQEALLLEANHERKVTLRTRDKRRERNLTPAEKLERKQSKREFQQKTPPGTTREHDSRFHVEGLHFEELTKRNLRRTGKSPRYNNTHASMR